MVIIRNIKNKIWVILYRFLFSPLFSLYHHEHIWHFFVNREATRLHNKDKPNLTAIQGRIITDLRERGVAKASFEELFLPELLAELINWAMRNSNYGHPDGFKPYIKNLFDEVPVIDLKSKFARVGLDKGVLQIVNAYLGMRAKLQEFQLTEIGAAPADSIPAYSQQWHRDPNETRRCKMFIYLSDVTNLENGPFTYLHHSNYGNKYANLFPQKPPSGFYPKNVMVERFVNPADINACLGQAGTVIFADTSGLHYGGFVKTGKRVMFVASFMAPKSLHGRDISFNPYLNGKERPEYKRLNDLAKYALVCDEENFSRKAYFYLKRKLCSW